MKFVSAPGFDHNSVIWTNADWLAVLVLAAVLAFLLIKAFWPRNRARFNPSLALLRHTAAPREPGSTTLRPHLTPAAPPHPFVALLHRKAGLPPQLYAAPAPNPQLTAVSRVDFETTPLLNREEVLLLPLLENIARQLGQGHRVMAQTSLGEVIRPSPGSGSEDQRNSAFYAVNAKRLDLAIFDHAGTLILAVEYQGTGHYQGDALKRDAVKREALRKAGVDLLEVWPDFDPEMVEAQVRMALNLP